MRESSDAVRGIRRILVVDDFAPWRVVASALLNRTPGLSVVAEAVDGFEAVHRAITLSPDIILMDIAMPGMNGIEAARRILENSPGCKILFFSELNSPDIAEEALRIGGRGYVVKSNAGRELIPALQAVLAGENFISARIADPEPARPASGTRTEANPLLVFGRSAAIPELLSSSIRTTEADFGTLQLFDSPNSALKIVAQFGFPSDFLKHFEAVDYTCDCPCARAMKTRLRVVVSDVSSEPRISDQTRRALLGAKVHALQATPLIGSRARFVGVVTTHYARPGGPLPEVLPKLDDLNSRFLAKITSEMVAVA